MQVSYVIRVAVSILFITIQFRVNHFHGIPISGKKNRRDEMGGGNNAGDAILHRTTVLNATIASWHIRKRGEVKEK